MRADFLNRALKTDLHQLGMAHQQLPELGELRAMTPALEHAIVQPAFQLHDAVRQRRLRHFQRDGGTAERAMPGDGQQIAQLLEIEFHSHGLWKASTVVFDMNR